MTQRKIQLVGNRSYSISLPKEWVMENKLKEKSIINVEITRNNDLLITNKGENSNKVVNILIDDQTPLVNLIFLCYNRNINELILKANSFSNEQKKSIKKAIQVLEGYSIIEESQTLVKIIGVNQLLDYNIEKLIKRIVYLIQVSCECLKKKDKATIEENEKEINRYYHLCKRILIRCITDYSLRQQNSINDTTEIFLWNAILKKIENIADIIYDMYSISYSPKTFNLIEKYILCLNGIYNGNETLNKLIELVNSHMSLNNRLKSIEGRVNLLCKDIVDNKIELNLNSKYFHNKNSNLT